MAIAMRRRSSSRPGTRGIPTDNRAERRATSAAARKTSWSNINTRGHTDASTRGCQYEGGGVGKTTTALGVITATPSAFTLDAQLAGTIQRETLLSRRLTGLTGFGIIVFDSSPAMNLLTYNVLLSASELVVPVGMDTMALAGARQTLDGIQEMRALWPERPLKLAAVVPTTVNSSTHASKATVGALAADAEMGPALFPRGIRQCIDLTYAAAAHQTIWEYAPASRAAADSWALLNFLNVQTTTEVSAAGSKTTSSKIHSPRNAPVGQPGHVA